MRSGLVRRRPLGPGHPAKRARGRNAAAVGLANRGPAARANPEAGAGSHSGLGPRADAEARASAASRCGAHPDADLGARPQAGLAAAARRLAATLAAAARRVAAAPAAATTRLSRPWSAFSLVTLVAVTLNRRRLHRVGSSLGFRMIRMHRAGERLWSIDRPASWVLRRDFPLP